MLCPSPSDQEIAIYVARMLDELVKLSRPLKDHSLQCLLAMSAYIAWCHYGEMQPPEYH